MPIAFPQLLLVACVLLAQPARGDEAIMVHRKSGQLVPLTSQMCRQEKEAYLCASLDRKNRGYRWQADFRYVCTDPGCGGQWLAHSKAMCQAPEAPCRKLREGMPRDGKGIDPWMACFKTCDASMQEDRIAFCGGCRKLDERERDPRPEPRSRGKSAEPSQPPVAMRDGDLAPLAPVRATAELSCGASERCLRDAAGLQRRAEREAHDRRLDFLRAAHDAREQQQGSVASAAQLLDAWKKQIDKNTSTISADERALYQSDAKLVQQATAAIPPSDGAPARGTFTAEDALRANDPDIMRQLVMNAEFHEQEKAYSQDATLTDLEEQSFRALALETANRADRLRGGLPAAESVATEPATAVADEASEGSGRGTLSGAAPSDLVARRERESAALAAAAAGEATVGERAELPARSGGLRELLRRRIASRGGAKGASAEALEGASFGGALNPVSRERGGTASAGGPSAAEEVMLGIAKKGEERRFTLGFAETEAEVRRLTASAQGAGDGESLFERIRKAHRACLERHCLAPLAKP